MSFQPRFTCDVCKKHKGDADHWFVAMPFFEQLPQQAGQPPQPGAKFLGVTPWVERIAQQPGAQHLCDEKCAHELLAKYLTPAKSKDEPRALKDVSAQGVCPYCGPGCFRGAAHNARVEDGRYYGREQKL